MAKKKPKEKDAPKQRSKLRVLIVAKQNKLGIRLAQKLAKELQRSVQEIQFDLSTAVRIREMRGVSLKKFQGDLVITVGGDGTFLWTAHQTSKPILPVRIEGHGFLCTIDFKDLMNHLDEVAAGKYEITERIRIKCTKIARGKMEQYIARLLHPKPYPNALNEIVFARRRPSKILHIEFKIDGVSFDFLGDGILIASPAGSTAYSASAGGPLIDPSLAALCVVPLYPFYSKVKPVIVPADKKIEVTVRAGECALILDGHGGDYVKPDAEFLVERGEPARVVTLTHHNFYEKFKNKFLG